MSKVRSAASVRRIGIPLVILLAALVLHGTAPAFESASGDRSAAAEARATRTGTPTHSPHTIRPRPSQTTPYPGGVGAPAGRVGDRYFAVADAEASGFASGATSFIWIGLIMAVLGLTVRWFFLAAKPDDET